MKYIVTNKFSSFDLVVDTWSEADDKATKLANETQYPSLIEYYNDDDEFPVDVEVVKPDLGIERYNIKDANDKLVVTKIETFQEAVAFATQLANRHNCLYCVCECFSVHPIYTARPRIK